MKAWMDRERYRRLLVLALLGLVLLGLMTSALLLGSRWYEPGDVLAVILGKDVSGVRFAVMGIRLPRMLAGLLVGLAFGLGGSTFQTLLRNPLASPDVIGITTASSLAAVFGILVLRISGLPLSVLAVVSGLAIALVLYLLGRGKQFSGGRLILVGIGFQALAQAGISWLMLGANQYDIPAAMRWLSGSLNGIRLEQIPPLLLVVLVAGGAILGLLGQLSLLELGDASATTLGLNTDLLRKVLLLAAVFLIGFASAISGPIAFVAFLAGPVAFGLLGPGPLRMVAAGLVGAILVLGADLVGQYALPDRYPVGVVTGLVGAPYLIYSLIKLNKAGRAT